MKHVTTVVQTRRLRDLFRRRYWCRCWHCPLRVGPYTTLDLANEASNGYWMNGAPMCPREKHG